MGERAREGGDVSVAEWLRQARADLDVAAHLVGHAPPAYAVFFAHLAVEKALKGLYRKHHGEAPPVMHNLRHLASRTRLLLPDDLDAFLDELSRASILDLYPDRGFASGGAAPAYDEAAARAALEKTHRLFGWITDHF